MIFNYILRDKCSSFIFIFWRSLHSTRSSASPPGFKEKKEEKYKKWVQDPLDPHFRLPHSRCVKALLASLHACLSHTHTHTAPIVYKPAALKTKHACNLPRMQPAQHAPLPCYNPPKAPPHHRSPVTTYPPLISYPIDQRHPIFTTLDGSDQTRVTATLYVSTSPRHVSHITTPLPHVSNIPTHLKPAAHVEEYV